MAMNLSNFGIVQGNLAKDPLIYENADGSKKVYLTVACRNNYSNKKDGTVGTEFVDLQAFVPKGYNMGPLQYLSKGHHVTLAYSVVHDRYEKDGKTVYTQTLRAYLNEIVLSPKGKSTTDNTDETDSCPTDVQLYDIPF